MAAQRVKKPPSRRAVLGLGAALLCLGLTLVLRGPELTAPKTLTYLGRELPIQQDVPVNRYDVGGFGRDSRGWQSYGTAPAGIDVSEHQGDIDWTQVAQSGIDFAMIRCGYRGYATGALREDSRFRENLRGAKAAGLEVGVYFFSQAVTPEEAREEARLAVELLEGQGLDYPIVFDWETIQGEDSARTWTVDGETVTRCAAAFCEEAELGGYEGMIYLNQDMGYMSYDLTQLPWPLWLAEYAEIPTFYYDFRLWQYSCTGQVPGISGPVDLNLDLREQ